MMKTLARYLLAVAGMVAVMLVVKLLIFVPPERLQGHTFRKEERTGDILWGKKISADGHDEPSNVFHNNSKLTGELGGGVVLPLGEKARGEEALKKFNVNVLASDLISLNRQVPDSRPLGCESVQYPDNLPATAVVIPFHNEWPSVLLRTVYSLINRTPKQMLHQIILVDDASDLVSLKDDLDQFIRNHFPSNLVKLVRLPERVGLIRARLAGFKYVTAEVVSFFDSHMEVNVNWLQPLLMEIVKDRRTVAMGHLDYIQPNTFEYSFIPGYRTRYGFDWRLIFFETYFLQSQMKDKDITDPLPGVVMVGPGFAINADYFREMGTYDEGMNIWGGENLELAWRVWLCGGRLVHLACSKLGHIARPQPYSFPGGRYETEIHNYKRAIEVWMGPYKQLVYQHHPKMKEIDVGDLTERLAIRDRLKCNNFTWYLHNVWPELYPYGDNATHWGSVRNEKEDMCLDNNDFLFLGPEKLYIKDCNYKLERQSFALTVDHRLRSVLQCVGVQQEEDLVPVLITCQDEPYHTWTYTRGQQLKHDQTALCLQLMRGPRLVMQVCRHGEEAQMWRFQHQGQWPEKQDSLQMPSIPRKSQRLDSLLDRNHRTADVWHDQAAGRNLPPEAVGVKREGPVLWQQEAVGVKREGPVLWQQEAAGVKKEGPVLWQQEENPVADKAVAQRNKVSSRRRNRAVKPADLGENAVARIHSRRKTALRPLGLHRDSVKVQVGPDLPVREDARWQRDSQMRNGDTGRWQGDSQMRNGDTGRWQGDSQMRNGDTGRWQGDSQMRNRDTGRWLKRAGRHEGALQKLSDRMQVGEEAGINIR